MTLATMYRSVFFAECCTPTRTARFTKLRGLCVATTTRLEVIDQIGVDVGVVGVLGEAREARLLQISVVVVRQVVDTDDVVAALRRAHGDVGTDEADRAGDEDFHGVLAGVRRAA